MSLTCADLATKVELASAITLLQNEIQTLRGQINNLLGQPEGGGVATMDVLSAGTLSGTVLAAGAVLDMEVVDDLATRTTKLVKTLGDGTKRTLGSATQGMTKIGNIAKGGAAAASAALTTHAGLIIDLGNLGLSVTNLVTNKVLGYRIDQTEKELIGWQRSFSDVYGHLTAAEEDIDEANRNITQLEADLTVSQTNNDVLRGQLQSQQASITSLSDGLERSELNNRITKRNISTLKTNLSDLETFATEEITSLKGAVTNLEQNLQVEKTNSEILTEVAQSLGEQTARLEGTVVEVTDRMGKLSTNQAIIRTELNLLKDDLANDVDLVASRVTTVASKVRVLEKEVRRRGSTGGGGVSVGVSNSITAQQNLLTQILSQMAGNPATVTDSSTGATETVNTNATYYDIVNDSTNFDVVTKELLKTVPDFTTFTGGAVTPSELDTWGNGFRNDVRSDFENALLVAGLVGLAPKVDTIANQTTPTAIAGATEAGICNSTTSPTGCMRNNILNPIQNNFGNLANGLGIGLNGANLGISTSILGKVTATQDFLTKAWGSTVVQNTLNATNTVLAFHNAFMLSRNLGQSIGDVASIALNALPIKAFDDSPIDVNAFVGQRVTQFAETTLGTTNYDLLVKGMNSANRILVAGQGLVASVHGIKNALQEGQEVIANRVGTLGNEFMEQGILEDNSFPWMSTNTNFTNPFLGFTQKVQDIDQFVNEVNQLVQSGIEVQENFNAAADAATSFKTASDKLAESFTQFDIDKTTEEGTRATESLSPAITNDDLVKDES